MSLSKRTNTLSSVPNMLMCLGSPLLQQVVVQPPQKNLLPNTWAIQIKEKTTNVSRKKTAIPSIRYDQQPRQVQTIQQYIIVRYHCQNKWIYSSSYNLTKRRNRWHKQDAQQYDCKSSKTLTTEPHFEGTDNVSWRKKAAVDYNSSQGKCTCRTSCNKKVSAPLIIVQGNNCEDEV